MGKNGHELSYNGIFSALGIQIWYRTSNIYHFSRILVFIDKMRNYSAEKDVLRVHFNEKLDSIRVVVSGSHDHKYDQIIGICADGFKSFEIVSSDDTLDAQDYPGDNLPEQVDFNGINDGRLTSAQMLLEIALTDSPFKKSRLISAAHDLIQNKHQEEAHNFKLPLEYATLVLLEIIESSVDDD